MRAQCLEYQNNFYETNFTDVIFDNDSKILSTSLVQALSKQKWEWMFSPETIRNMIEKEDS